MEAVAGKMGAGWWSGRCRACAAWRRVGCIRRSATAVVAEGREAGGVLGRMRSCFVRGDEAARCTARNAKYTSFVAARSLGKCPRVRTARRTVLFRLSIALVV